MQSENYSNRDHGDFLRSGDVCPKKGETDFQHSYCPEAPDCDWSGEWGKAKLCITRVPFPSDLSKFYALSMKCIPYWANCDKCVCGTLRYPYYLSKFKFFIVETKRCCIHITIIFIVVAAVARRYKRRWRRRSM